MTKRHMGAYLCALLLFGTLGLFVRQAHVAGDVLAFLRTLIGAAFLGVLLLLRGLHQLPYAHASDRNLHYR